MFYKVSKFCAEKRKMFEDEKFSRITLKLLIQVPVFALTVIIYGLSVSILNDTVTSASIALPQFASDGVSLNGIFNGVIALGALYLFIQFCIFYIDWKVVLGQSS